MSSPAAATPGAAPAAAPEKSYFEQQRDQLRSEIALTMEHLLMNMNTLNRNLESIVAVRR
jgi:DASH complex subunit DAD1